MIQWSHSLWYACRTCISGDVFENLPNQEANQGSRAHIVLVYIHFLYKTLGEK